MNFWIIVGRVAKVNEVMSQLFDPIYVKLFGSRVFIMCYVYQYIIEVKLGKGIVKCNLIMIWPTTLDAKLVINQRCKLDLIS